MDTPTACIILVASLVCFAALRNFVLAYLLAIVLGDIAACGLWLWQDLDSMMVLPLAALFTFPAYAAIIAPFAGVLVHGVKRYASRSR